MDDSTLHHNSQMDDQSPRPMRRYLSEEPTDHDVKCGRGHIYAKHPGNKAFQQLIRDNTTEYAAATGLRDKSEIIDDVLFQVHDAGGRFLEQDGNVLTNKWYEINRTKANTKIAHSLRDTIRNINRQSHTGTAHSSSATIVTPNDDSDLEPLPLEDLRSSTDNFTLDLENHALFLTDDDDCKKRSLPGSPVRQDVFDDEVVHYQLTKGKTTTFFDDLAEERKNYATYGAYPEDDCFLGRPEDHVNNNNNEPQSQPGNTGWGLPPPQQRPWDMPRSSPAVGLEAVLRMEREEHEMQLKQLQDQIKMLKEQEHNKQQQQGPPSSSVQSPPQQRPPAQQQPPLYAQRPMGSYPPPPGQQQLKQYNDDFTNTTPDTTTAVTTVTDRHVTEKTTTEEWGSFHFSMATGDMAALGIVETETSKKRESSTEKKRESLTEKKRESLTEKKRESSTENAGNTGTGGGVDKNEATSKKRKSSTENAGNNVKGSGGISVVSASGSALASAKKRQKMPSTIDTTTLLLPENFEPSDWDVIVRRGKQSINHGAFLVSLLRLTFGSIDAMSWVTHALLPSSLLAFFVSIFLAFSTMLLLYYLFYSG